MQDNTKLDLSAKIKILKDSVLKMLSEKNDNSETTGTAMPAPIWSDVLGIFSYMLSLTPEDYMNVRFHTGLITGENVFQYWHAYPPIQPEVYAETIGYNFNIKNIPEQYWIGEPTYPRMPGPVGVMHKGKIINGNISRYQNCVTNLYSMGVLEGLKKDKGKIVVEIGGGYGGLAHAIGNILSHNATYVIIDLPEMLLFSGSHLIVNNPDKNIYIYDRATFTPQFIRTDIFNYDYVLLPNYVLNQLYSLPDIHLMINMQSFQEMTAAQIEDYLKLGCSKLSGYLYSDNIDMHPLNKNLCSSSVTKLLAGRYKLFPQPDFYDKNFRDVSDPWFYKCYFGIPKNSKAEWPEQGSMRLLRSKKYVLTCENGQVRFTVDWDWRRELFWLGKKILKLYRRDLSFEKLASRNI